MDFVRLLLNIDHGWYSYKGSSSIAMDILGRFFKTDVGCRVHSDSYITYQNWALDDDLGDATSSNITELEKEGPYIYLRDLYSDEQVPTNVKMLRSQFVQLVDEWQEKVCKSKPKEVIIKHENDEFFIETKD